MYKHRTLCKLDCRRQRLCYSSDLLSVFTFSRLVLTVPSRKKLPIMSFLVCPFQSFEKFNYQKYNCKADSYLFFYSVNDKKQRCEKNTRVWEKYKGVRKIQASRAIGFFDSCLHTFLSIQLLQMQMMNSHSTFSEIWTLGHWRNSCYYTVIRRQAYSKRGRVQSSEKLCFYALTI
jgi:hypothetical protein